MYELMVIAKADGADATVEKHLKDLAVTDMKKQSMGRKQLAYPIKKISEAEYFIWTFEAEGAAVNQLDNKLRLEQELILRHLLTVFDPKKAARVSKVSVAPEVASIEPKVEQQKAKPKVTVTTKIVASKESKSTVKVKSEAKAKKGKE
jgi:small subunit ribosomal protein S6